MSQFVSYQPILAKLILRIVGLQLDKSSHLSYHCILWTKDILTTEDGECTIRQTLVICLANRLLIVIDYNKIQED
jgi:hypothetical protein